MPQAAAYRNDTHAMPHRDEKRSSPTSFFDTFFQKSTLPQSNTSPVITNTLTNYDNNGVFKDGMYRTMRKPKI